MAKGGMLIAVLLLVLGLGASSATAALCTTDDIRGAYTQCSGGVRNAYFYYVTPCDTAGGPQHLFLTFCCLFSSNASPGHTGAPLPSTVGNLPCNITCPTGQYLPIGQTACQTCGMGTYSPGGGDVYDTWNAIPFAFSTDCSSDRIVNVTCGSAPWTVSVLHRS